MGTKELRLTGSVPRRCSDPSHVGSFLKAGFVSSLVFRVTTTEVIVLLPEFYYYSSVCFSGCLFDNRTNPWSPVVDKPLTHLDNISLLLLRKMVHEYGQLILGHTFQCFLWHTTSALWDDFLPLYFCSICFMARTNKLLKLSFVIFLLINLYS